MRASIRFSAACAAVLFLVLLAISRATGADQQWFESVRDPATYAAALARHSTGLRALIAVDDLFIVAYAAVGLALGEKLRRAPVARALTAAVLIAATLDLLENHHILAMLRAAPGAPALAQLELQMTLSMTKWALAHGAFVLFALELRPTNAADRAVKAAMLFAQMPVGVLLWTHPSPLLESARALNLFTGFAYLALRGDAIEVARDAPA